MDDAQLIAARLTGNSEVDYKEWGPFWRLRGRVRIQTMYGARFAWKTLEVGISFSQGARLRSAKQICIDHGIFQPDPVLA